jgi:hypothetical protein
VKDPQQPAAADDDAPWSLERESASAKQLARWAIIDPDQVRLYSTRRFGRPLSMLRRLLARMQRQYMSDVAAQQSRFNAQMTAYAERLEKRIEALEASSDKPDQPLSR